MPFKSSVPLFWRLKKSKYCFIGTKCVVCGCCYFPPKTFCPSCRRKGKIEEVQLSGNGKILSYTVIRVPPEGFENNTPYAVAIIGLDEGPNISGQVVGNINKIDIDKRVKTVFRKITEDGQAGLINYGFKFKLIDE